MRRMSTIARVACGGFRGVLEEAARVVEDRSRRGPLALAATLILVPTAAAAHLARRRIEDALLERSRPAALMPRVTTPQALAEARVARLVDPLLREALLDRAFEKVQASGLEPPFTVRASLAARVLELHDEIRLRGGELEAFIENALEELDAPDDEGALRLTQQTRFLANALREYGARLEELDLVDGPTARARIGELASRFETVLILGDETLTPLELASFESRESSDVRLLVAEGGPDDPPRLLAPTGTSELSFVARDREEALRDVARLMKHLASLERLPPLERIAVVVPTPLPYLYLAKKVFHEAGIPFELQDSFPLAREPVVAALDLALDLVEHDASRESALALLRSPFFRFVDVGPDEVAAFDGWTMRRREAGSLRRWRELLERRRRPPLQPSLPGLLGGSPERATRALEAVVAAAELLAPLSAPESVADKIARLQAFATRFGLSIEETYANPEVEPERERANRASRALQDILERLSDASRQVGDPLVDFQSFRERLRRAVGAHTFALRAGRGGVAIVDSRSAALGAFDLVILLGLNEGEWPQRSERNIFYPQRLLHPFGWPTDRELLAAERRRFRHLLGLATKRIALFRHQLEDEVPTVPTPFLEDVETWLEERRAEPERLALELGTLVVSRPEALRRGLPGFEAPSPARSRPGVVESPPRVSEPISPTSFELFLRCPFKYFSRYLLGVEEEEMIDESLSPLERGRILHEILHEAFEAWDGLSERPRPVTAEDYDEALALFRRKALTKLRGAPRRIELTRLFGNDAEPGAIPWLLRRELARGAPARRLVEYGFEAPLKLERGPSGESPWYVRIKGRVDRADVDADGFLHVLDYKSGRAPATETTLQVPLYAMALAQELGVAVREAAYLSFRDHKTTSRADFDDTIERLRRAYAAIAAGDFAPRPYREPLCASCGFVGLCRKQIEEETA